MSRQILTLAVLATLTAATVGVGTSPPITLVRHFTPADQVSGRYQYVPFDVPRGTTRLHVRYAYDRAQDTNTIDLGLFEPGTLDLGTTALRGYSGGSKSEVTIDARDATRGYRAGPLPAGRWHILLGLYKVAPAGVDVTITVELTSTPVSGAAPTHAPVVRPPPPPGAVPARWYAGALHTHTLHSDGTISPLDLLRKVRDTGLDFVAITDHNNTTHRYELQRQHAGERLPLWIVGEEVTTPGGHASVWGLDEGEWIDFRVRAGDPRIGDLVRAAGRYGALFSINHPRAACVACAWEHDILDGITGIEVWNGRHGAQNEALETWDALLTKGRRITGIGAADWHGDPAPIDGANVRVFAASPTAGAILDGIRAGRVIAMRDARAATPDVLVRAGDRVARVGDTLVTGGGPVAIEVSARDLAGGRIEVIAKSQAPISATFDADGRVRLERRIAPGYMRLQMYAADGSLLALTNPVFLAP